MKKITLLAVALISAVSFGQNIIVDRLQDNTTGLIDVKGDDGTAVYCADYFEITSNTAIGSLTIPGLNSNGGSIAGDVISFNIFIYQDLPGEPNGNPEIPGGGVAEVADIVTPDFILTEDGFGSAIFEVPSVTTANGGNQVVLAPGNYWMCVFPSVIGAPTGNARWNWYGSLSGAPAIEPVLIDPFDLFGAGATNWTNISGLIAASFPSFAWTMTDEPILDINENTLSQVSVYPNPATTVLNVKLPSNVEVTSSSLTDMLGRTTGVVYANGEMNIAGLSQGVYFLNLNTNFGTYTQKFVKQ